MLRNIYYFIHQGYNIGINFREVFLVPDGEAPPPHFRPGIDICVTNVIEYKKITEKFSYQLGKFFRMNSNLLLPPNIKIKTR